MASSIRDAQLALLEEQARTLARVSDSLAPVYLFSDADVPMFDTLRVLRSRIKNILPVRLDSPPIVLGWCVKDTSLRVVKGYAISAELWAQRDRLPYIGYDVDNERYDIVLTAIPRAPRPHTILIKEEGATAAAAEAELTSNQVRPLPRTTTSQSCCTRFSHLKTLWITREDVVNWLSVKAPPITSEAAAHYAESSLFMLEQRALLVQKLIDPELAIDRMRHGIKFLFPKLAMNRLSGAASYAASVLGVSMASPFLNASIGKKPNGAERLGLRDALYARNSAGMTLASAWLASEDTFVRYMLSDPREGFGGCTACTERLMVALRQTLIDNAPNAPWIRALHLVGDRATVQPLGSLAPIPPDAAEHIPWYHVPRTLAYRMPAETEDLRENRDTGEWTASRTTFLYEVVPLIVDKLGLDVLWDFFDIAMRPAHEVPASLTYAIDVSVSKMAATRSALEGTLGRMGHEAVRGMQEWRTKIETPLMERNLLAHPIAAPPLAASTEGSGNMKESLREWYKDVRDKHKAVASHLMDIEDLLTRNLMPPCMKRAVKASRDEGTLHNYMARFVVTAWITDLGYNGADAVKLLGISDANVAKEIAAHARSAQKNQAKVREGQCASWACGGNMNSQSGLVTDCAMRKVALGNADTGGKLDSKENMVKVRWACTETLPNYVSGEWPQHAIVHPLDYVVMRLQNE
jgi:hypothetical protein